MACDMNEGSIRELTDEEALKPTEAPFKIGEKLLK